MTRHARTWRARQALACAPVAGAAAFLAVALATRWRSAIDWRFWLALAVGLAIAVIVAIRMMRIAVHESPQGLLTVINPIRTYQLRIDEIGGFHKRRTWTAENYLVLNLRGTDQKAVVVCALSYPALLDDETCASLPSLCALFGQSPTTPRA